MASAVISGWPDAPDSPLQSGPLPGGLAGTVPVVAPPASLPGNLKIERRSKPWAWAIGVMTKLARVAAAMRRIGRTSRAMQVSDRSGDGFRLRYGEPISLR